MKINSSLIPSENYSTSEKKVGTWVDNKPIYSKTIYISSLPNKTSADYNHGISNIDNIWVDMSNSFIKWENGQTSPFNYLGSAGSNSTLNNAIEVRLINQTKFSIETYATDRRALVAYVTLRYTKNS